MTSLASIERARTGVGGAIDAMRLSRDAVEALLARMAALPLAERRCVPGFLPERADVIVAGAAIAAAVMARLGAPALRVTARGLRHGLLLDRFGVLAAPATD